jgi:hypothetical protein
MNLGVQIEIAGLCNGHRVHLKYAFIKHHNGIVTLGICENF